MWNLTDQQEDNKWHANKTLGFFYESKWSFYIKLKGVWQSNEEKIKVMKIYNACPWSCEWCSEGAMISYNTASQKYRLYWIVYRERVQNLAVYCNLKKKKSERRNSENLILPLRGSNFFRAHQILIALSVHT